jgi:hypothetical protein
MRFRAECDECHEQQKRVERDEDRAQSIDNECDSERWRPVPKGVDKNLSIAAPGGDCKRPAD